MYNPYAKGIGVPQELVTDIEEACENAHIETRIWNLEDYYDSNYTGLIHIKVQNHNYNQLIKILHTIKSKKDPNYKQQELVNRIKECWPQGKMKSTTAPKILYFIHNLAEFIAVWYIENTKFEHHNNSYIFNQASRIEYLTRNIIADYKTR